MSQFREFRRLLASYQGSGAADNLALEVVLGAVARAHELVLGLVPGDDAAKVGAHGVHTVVSEGAIVLDHEVGGITLQALGQGAIASLVGREPGSGLHVIAVGVLGSDTSATATR